MADIIPPVLQSDTFEIQRQKINNSFSYQTQYRLYMPQGYNANLIIDSSGIVGSPTYGAATSYTIPSSSISMSVYLASGTWQLVVETRAANNDAGGNCQYSVYQKATVASPATTAYCGIQLHRNGGAGFGRDCANTAYGVATITVTGATSTTLTLNAPVITITDANTGFYFMGASAILTKIA